MTLNADLDFGTQAAEQQEQERQPSGRRQQVDYLPDLRSNSKTFLASFTLIIMILTVDLYFPRQRKIAKFYVWQIHCCPK